MEPQNRSRSFHDLPEMSGEGSETPLLVCSGAGARPRTLAKARTDPRAAHWHFHPRAQMGATQPKHCRSHHLVNCTGHWFRRDWLEACVRGPNAEECRCAAVRKPKP